MCYLLTLVFTCTWQYDIINSQTGVFLTVTGFLGEMILMFESEDDNFVAFDQTL